jgi:NADH-quinone oxidoreductase subunit D
VVEVSDETPRRDPSAPGGQEPSGPSHREQDAPAGTSTTEREAGASAADLLGGTPGGPLTTVADGPADQSDQAARAAYRAGEESIDFSAELRAVATRDDAELLTINMGPHHPATHGVLRLLTTLEGEVVRDVKPVIGYLHTGIEKTAEDKAYWKAIPVVERMDYLAYYFNAMAYVGAVEDLLDLEVPKRAQYLRVIHLELNRIMSHLVWLGTTMLDLGAISIFWYAFRERETILDLFEYSSGQRMHTRYFQVGGVAEDIPVGWEQKLREFLVEMPKRLDQYDAMLKKNEIVLRRLRHTGVLDAETLQGWGVTGPLLRAAGVPWDLRKAMPYSSYDDFAFQIPVGIEGDNYDRYLVRTAEMRESVRIIEQAIDGLPEGPWITEDRKVALPPRHELATSMEALIHHFKLVTEGFRVPPGEAYHAIEGPRGELGCFVRSDGSSKPARVHVRDPSFVNLQAYGDMARGEYIADLIATLACLDPLLGGIDR